MAWASAASQYGYRRRYLGLARVNGVATAGQSLPLRMGATGCFVHHQSRYDISFQFLLTAVRHASYKPALT